MSSADGRRAALREFVLVAVLYAAYDTSRALADKDVTTAVGRAARIARFEQLHHLSWEVAVNQVFVDHDWLGVLGDYWYSTAHYVGTIAVLVWLYRRSRDVYVRARRALALATMMALALFLLLPTAPPRMLSGYVDVLRLHAGDGWWGSDASAPRGLGGYTNQLAAFPSLHAGWSLWVALAITSATYSKVARGLGWAYAATTALVVVGTANHWVVDVLVGWAVVAVAWLISDQAARLAAGRLRRQFAASLPGRHAPPGRPRSAASQVNASP